MVDVTLPAAAAAGLLSFLSPCVLPLAPPYLAYIAGTSVEELADADAGRARREVFFASLLFVAGFATVFVTLGASASAFGQLVRQYVNVLSVVAGVAIIVMGLHFLGLFRLGLLYREARLSVGRPLGPLGAYVMGLAFAFGWTPCIGPILAAILTVAGSQASVGRGALLLAVYSAGLGLPFVAAAIAIGPSLRFIGRFKRHFGLVEKTVGGLLVVTGIAFLTGAMQTLSFWLISVFPGLAKLG
ncbi:MAG TPA: cytochrome c biogenesis protein CcdA [Beijerinckiaceae bacterium]|nr:cytochrome c biogenesis protein CcdA [Beijerinckiaceae bacterium]